MFSKMVTKVATFFKDRATTTMSALEVKFYSHRFWISHLYGLVPVARDSFKCFGFRSELRILAWALFSFAAFFNLVSKEFCLFF